MGKQYERIGDSHREFIEAQKLFFVATAAPDGRVNVSPKGMDSLQVVGPNRVLWLNVTGSGNETAAHLRESDRMTLMFCAFEGAPMILRLYGHARTLHPRDAEWDDLIGGFPPLPGARQIYDLRVDLVQTSCGTAVPLFDYVEDRDQLNRTFSKRGEEGVRRYWAEKNTESIDGRPTGILEPESD